MKTSLVCLLLLAAVACAAPKAGMIKKAKNMAAMAERAGRALAVSKKAEEMPGMAEEAAEAVVAADTAVETEAAGERESRIGFGYSPCYGECAPFGCYFDGCISRGDIIFYDGYCFCCAVRHLRQCYY